MKSYSLTRYYYHARPGSPVKLARVGNHLIKKQSHIKCVELANILGYSLISRLSLPTYQYRKYPRFKLNGKSYALIQQGTNFKPTLSRELNTTIRSHKELLKSTNPNLQEFGKELDALIKKYQSPKGQLFTFLIEYVKYKRTKNKITTDKPKKGL